MNITDSHCHLQDLAFADDLERVLQEATHLGVHRFVVNGTCPEDWPKVAALAELYPQVVPQFGVHPWKVEDLPGKWLEELRGYLLRFQYAGLGEIGLDRKMAAAPMALQTEIFQQQVRLACTMDRPCTFHILKAWEEFWQVLKKWTPPKFLMHSFRGSAEQINAFADYEAYFSFGGAVLRHPHSKKMSAAIRAVPSERLLLETDAPYQHPQGLKIRQEPAGILNIAQKVAEIRGGNVLDVMKTCDENAGILFAGTEKRAPEGAR